MGCACRRIKSVSGGFLLSSLLDPIGSGDAVAIARVRGLQLA
jgi:hypothetical protein